MALDTSPEAPAPVRQIANAIAGWVDRLGVVWVEGQVAQVSRRPGLNTVFLTLRDSVADISVPVTCSRVLFDGLNPPLVEGASVLLQAKPSYYANRGTLSLQAREIRMVGLGELLARLERRRQLLAAEGLFAAELKRPLPFLPRCVGLVTAARSAAERDVLDNAARRWPAVSIEVAHASMQGHRSAAEVIEAVQRLDRDPRVDVIVVARGGGSVEDLLPFSDEGLVRAVAAVRTPVVSAIGHEPDTPLLDLVADARASTPTDAAKMVVPDVAQEVHGVGQARLRMRQAVAGRITREQSGLDALRTRPVLADPRVAGRRPAPTSSTCWCSAPGAACGTRSTGPTTTSPTTGPARGPCHRWPPWSGATPSSRTTPATCSPASAPPSRAPGSASGSPTAACTPRSPTSNP